jgi:hypothetical protein
VSDEDICSAGVGGERNARLVHGKHAVVSCCVGVGVGVRVGVGVGVGVGVRVGVGVGVRKWGVNGGVVGG